LFGGAPPRISLLESGSWVNAAGESKAEAIKSSIHSFENEAELLPADPPSQLVYLYSIWLTEAMVAALNGESVHAVLSEAQRKANIYYNCISTRPMDGLDQTQLFEQVISPCKIQAES